MSVNITITTAGRAALVNASHTGTAPVTITQVGISQSAVVPSVGATTLAGELKRISGVSGDVVAADTIHINMTDESADAYSLRSFALYLADGTLFGIYGQTDPLIIKTAGSIAAIAIDTIFADINAALLTFGNANFTNPPATTERQGVVELATVPEAQAGIDALRALTPSVAKAAILGWLLTQDGSGSGLDADLLDGQNGTYYADVAARLGFVPVNRAGDTMAGLLALSANPTANLHAVTKQYADALVTAAALLAKLVTVDGSGSGLDADLLDGQNGTYYAPINSPEFLGVLKAAGDLMLSRVDQAQGFILRPNLPGFKNIAFAVTGGGTLERIDLQTAGAYILGSAIWHAANDGAGSGLDADMVDGIHASALVKQSDYSASFSDNGYTKLPNGLFLQWGWVSTMPNQAMSTVTFPLTFPNAVLGMWATLGNSLFLTQNRVGVGAQAISNSQGNVAVSADTSGTTGCRWLAIGF